MVFLAVNKVVVNLVCIFVFLGDNFIVFFNVVNVLGKSFCLSSIKFIVVCVLVFWGLDLIVIWYVMMVLLYFFSWNNVVFNFKWVLILLWFSKEVCL